MPFIPTPNGVKVCMKFTKAGQQCCNIFHVRVPSAPDEAMLNTIGSIFKTAWNDKLETSTANDTTLDAIEVTDISTAGGLGIVYTTGLPEAGGPGNNPLPNNVTVATKLLTGRTGRSYRGRFYMNGVSAPFVTADAQHITPTMQGHLRDFVDQLVADLLLEGLNLAIASFFSGGVPRTSGVLTDVTGATINSTLDSQRRRLPERGS